MVLSAPRQEQISFQRGRVYAPVPGYIGRFLSLWEAHRNWLSRPEATAEPPLESAESRQVTAEVQERKVYLAGSSSLRQVQPKTLGVVLLPVQLRRPLAIKPRAVDSRTQRLARHRKRSR